MKLTAFCMNSICRITYRNTLNSPYHCGDVKHVLYQFNMDLIMVCILPGLNNLFHNICITENPIAYLSNDR